MKPIDRLRQQYKATKKEYNGLELTRYNAIRLFCLDCGLLTFLEIEAMEFEVNQSLSD
jgi:hypothetical protein